MQTLEAFAHVHDHDTVVVCGCGASLDELTTPERFVTIGVNDVGRLFDPTYLVVVNSRHQFTPERFRYVEESRARHLFTHLDLGVRHPAIVRFRLGRYGGTTFTDPHVLHYTRNSPYVALCLAIHMGARTIGLIGVDFTEHHFFGATGVHSLAPHFPAIDEEYRKLHEAAAAMGIRIVNLSRRSRLTSFPRGDVEELAAGRPRARSTARLRIVSYATTPVAGVPAILARCIAADTPHECRCVWATRTYGNGVSFDGDLEWTNNEPEADAVLEKADVIVAHNGKIDPRHERLIAGKHVVTLAHNYMWNVDRRFERQGLPAFVVGQYQATLPEFATWTAVPNPVPVHEKAYTPALKPPTVTICYTPSGRHERYPPGHRLYWHAKGYSTTMRVLDRLHATLPVRIEVVRGQQVSHAEALAMKRRAHIVIDECVTGSYHRNSLEGLSVGCVVVNGVGLLPAVVETLNRCAGTAETPFVFSSLDTLESVLRALIERGADALLTDGMKNRAWMERHWDFASQWSRFWAAALDPPGSDLRSTTRAAARTSLEEQNMVAKETHSLPAAPAILTPASASHGSDSHAVTVVIPHGGHERLRQLIATLVTMKQRPGVGEVIVAELGEEPLARDAAERWADKHLYVEHAGPFDRARALNAGAAIAECEFVLWLDNDLLVPPEFVTRSVRELCDRRLDYLIPYTSVRYLSEVDSNAIIRGERNPESCRPVNTFYSARRTAACFGGIGLVRGQFLRKHGGLVEGFRGWGGEDNAWTRKVSLLGRYSATMRQDQHVHHLYHAASGGYAPGAAIAGNPNYADNLKLLRRVWAIRDPQTFVRQFPARLPVVGTITASNGRVRARASEGACVWTYWEGPCSPWIHACRQTITAHAPRIRVLTPERFDTLRDRDRDIDLSRLHAPHRADYIRAFLLARYGGLWIDADCLVMQPLEPLLNLLEEHDFVGHRERVGLISNAFIAARPGSRIAAAFYGKVCHILRSRTPLYWNALGADPLTAIVAADAQGWFELPCERVQPICWSRPEDFFVERDRASHDESFDPRAICYMLSNGAINNYTSRNRGADLLKGRTFFRYLLGRALNRAEREPFSVYERVFAANADLYRRQRSESLSGPGSCLAQTRELRERLPLALEELGVRSLLDAPCGDLNWMQHVQLGSIEYVGVDILGEIIADNEWRHDGPHRRFLRADVVHEVLPAADAVLCRDLLSHLSYDDIFRTVANFKRSGARVLLTTTYTAGRANTDTADGEWRPIDLTRPPFGFPPPLRLINEGCTEGGGTFADKSIGVWKLEDLRLR